MKDCHVLYIAPYVDEDVKRKRGYGSSHPAGNKKIKGIVAALNNEGLSVDIISPLLLKNNKFKFYKSDYKKLEGNNLLYPFTVDLKFFSLLMTLFSTLYTVLFWYFKNFSDKKIIIFYNYRLETSIPAILSRILLKVPIIVDYEDGIYAIQETNKYYKKLTNLVEKISVKFLSGGILVTSLLNDRLHLKNYEVIRGVIKKENLRKLPSKTELGNEINIVYTGRLDYERGVEVFIESIRYLHSSDKKINIFITGYGPLVKFITDFVENNYINDISIKFMGFLNDEEYEHLMKSADIFINPQRESIAFSECSFPSKILEYIQYNRIIISSNVSDISKFNNEYFVIYNNDSPVNLANEINNVIENYSVYSSFPKRATKWAEENATEESLSDILGSLIKRSFKERKHES